MASNRIYLRCKECGEKLYLGKRLGEDYWYDDYDGISLKMKLNDFYSDHYFKHFSKQDCFDICYEIEPNELVDKLEGAKVKMRELKAGPGTLWIPESKATEMLGYYTGMDVQITGREEVHPGYLTCYCCGGKLRWESDASFEEAGFDDADGLISFYTCDSCNAWYEIWQPEGEEP